MALTKNKNAPKFAVVSFEPSRLQPGTNAKSSATTRMLRPTHTRAHIGVKTRSKLVLSLSCSAYVGTFSRAAPLCRCCQKQKSIAREDDGMFDIYIQGPSSPQVSQDQENHHFEAKPHLRAGKQVAQSQQAGSGTTPSAKIVGFVFCHTNTVTKT
jgi:hypothetical protein